MTLRRSAYTTFTLALCATLNMLATNAAGATRVFEATSAFALIDAGEVPYYSEAPARNSLAINAAKVNFRDRFARATMVFEGPSGFFDITLTTLAELDGEAPYRVLINEVLVGSASNPETSIDYTPVRHTFEHIVVPEGATIAVESLANTNGRIPEGDGTAFARGRWTLLELTSDDAGSATGDTIDLSISASTDATRVTVGESRTLVFAIGNAVDSAVATQPVMTLTRPRSEVGVDIESLENCKESGNDIICNLSEIPAAGSEQVSITLTVLEPSPAAMLRVTVSADQVDADSTDNSITLPFRIDAGVVTAAPPAPETDNQDAGDPESIAPDATAGETTSGNRSGGGASGALSLILLAAAKLRRRCQGTEMR